MEKRSRVKVDEIAKDRISDLPDDIILLVMSFLTLKEAGRTSLISRRWRGLWCTLTDLTIDDLGVMGMDYSKKEFKKRSRITVAERKVLDKERRNFIRRVGEILPHHQSPIINSFKIRFHMDINFSPQIDSWLQTALTKRAKKVDIDLSEFSDYRYLNPPDDEYYNFPCRFFTEETAPSVKYLSIKYCVCTPPEGFSGFRFLTELRLESVFISTENVEYILSSTSHLERLSLISCWQLEKLKIAGRNLALKYLTVAECYSLGIIEIDSDSLIKFDFYGPPVGLLFHNVPQLVNVVIYTVQKNIVAGISYALGTLSTNIPQLRSLLLHAKIIERNMIPQRLPTFAHLKQLVLMISGTKGSLFNFFALLQAAPFLERLELHLPFEMTIEKEKKVGKPPISPLLYLKEFILSGLGGSQDEVDFVTHVIRNAEIIKSVTIYYAKKDYRYDKGIHEWAGYGTSELITDVDARHAARRRKAEFVAMHIEKVIPVGAKLMIK